MVYIIACKNLNNTKNKNALEGNDKTRLLSLSKKMMSNVFPFIHIKNVYLDIEKNSKLTGDLKYFKRRK